MTITNWELGYTLPKGQHVARILTYLRYTPLFDFAGTTLSKRVQQFMYVNGLSQKECAKIIGIDEGTVGRVVREERVFKKTIQKIQVFLCERLINA